MTNVLVITTTVRMVHGIHCNTPSLWPRVSLDAVLVEGPSGLQEGLINDSTRGNDSNGSTAVGIQDLFGPRGQFHTGLSLVDIVGNDSRIVSSDTGHGPTVSYFFLNVANDCALWHGREREDISNRQRCYALALASVSYMPYSNSNSNSK